MRGKLGSATLVAGLLLGSGCPSFQSVGDTTGGDSGDTGGDDTATITTTLGASSGMPMTTSPTPDGTGDTTAASTMDSTTTSPLDDGDTTAADTMAVEDSGTTSSTGTDTTTAAEESSSSTGEPVPTGVWANCPQGESCMDVDAECLQEPKGASSPDGICAFPCQGVEECPAEPATGDAVVTCGVIPGTDGNADFCYLSCAGGESCPNGMYCDFDVCWYANVTSYEGCSGVAIDPCPAGHECLGNGVLSACAPECADGSIDGCPAFPVDSDPLACGDLGGDGMSCHVPCSGANPCPEGWECANGTFCAQTNL